MFKDYQVEYRAEESVYDCQSCEVFDTDNPLKENAKFSTATNTYETSDNLLEPVGVDGFGTNSGS
jgi:hypothetical protein